MNRGQHQAVQKGQVGQDEVRRLTRRWHSMPLAPHARSPGASRPSPPGASGSPQSIRSLAKVVRVLGSPGGADRSAHSTSRLDAEPRGQVLTLALYHQQWLWISFPGG
jgi:hypothetical protein